MEQLTTLYIDKESHKFSAAHYTIFSATERERLHGHNYSVSAKIVAPMGDNGFAADYNVYKERLARLCDGLDEYMLLVNGFRGKGKLVDDIRKFMSPEERKAMDKLPGVF